MYIHGTFKDKEGNDITVKFLKGNSFSEEHEISEYTPIAFSDDPIEISTECDNTFTHIIKKSCTIRLVTSRYLGDMMFGNNADDVKVNILRGNECIFAGFVTPNMYTQPYANSLETVEIECIDYLATLQYRHLSDGTTYDRAKAASEVKRFDEILWKIGLSSTFSIDGTTSAVYYDKSKTAVNGTGVNIFKDMSLSEAIFFGDEEDDEMSGDEILEEILKYLNLHIVQEGLNFYIFDWNSKRSLSSIKWIDLKTNNEVTTTSSLKTVALDWAASDDTTISVGDVYNQIRVRADIEKMDTLIENPLDSDLLTSRFKNYQKYMTELKVGGEGWTALDAFYNVVNGLYPDDYTDPSSYTDWYMQVMENKNWDFGLNGHSIYDAVYEQDANGEYINQWKFPMYLKQHRFASCIMNIGHVDKNYTDSSSTATIDMNPYLCISVLGSENDSESMFMEWDERKEAVKPICSYKSPVSGVYSPVNDSITNYIVFSGKFLYAPLTMKTGVKWNYSDSDRDIWYRSCNTFYELVDEMAQKDWRWHLIFHTVPYGSSGDNQMYYTNKFWKQIYAVDGEPWYDSSDYWEYLTPPITGIENKKYIEYNGSYQYTGDKIQKVPVLECQIKIGDKYCVETFEPTEYAGVYKSKYGWYTYENCPVIGGVKRTTFTLGFNPKIGDKVIGQEYEFETNFDYTYNIGAKSGTAIPITADDKLSGNIEFSIIGPVNSKWSNDGIWWTWNDTEEGRSVLSRAEAIYIKEFECKLYTNNGKQSSNDVGNDVMYVSDEVDYYLNRADDIEMKINTALTPTEASKLGVSATVNMSTAINTNTGLPVTEMLNTITGDSAKPEQLYCSDYFGEYSNKKLQVETDWHVGYVEDNDVSNTIAGYFNRYKFNYINGKTFYPIAYDYNVRDAVVDVRLKEI